MTFPGKFSYISQYIYCVYSKNLIKIVGKDFNMGSSFHYIAYYST